MAMIKSNISNIFIILCVFLSGCAAIKYPGWETVQIKNSVFKQPCIPVGPEEHCTDDNCNDWYQKRATIYKANTVLKNANKSSASYFMCKTGLPPFLYSHEAAWLVKNIYYPSATKLDFSKANDECTYEAHSATIDNDRKFPTRTYINTGSYDVNTAQLNAMNMDRINEDMHGLHLSVENMTLKSECMKAKGFVFTRSADKKDIEAIKIFCPDIDNGEEPCFIPAQ